MALKLKNSDDIKIIKENDTIRLMLTDILKSRFDEISLEMHPVGSLYISADDTNPSTLFGGVWEQIKDTFILAAGDTYEAGSEGGEATHRITVDEMPSHIHDMDDALYGGNLNIMGVRGDGGGGSKKVPSYSQQNALSTYKPTATGGNQPHNNMPPYKAFYVWQRVE